MTVLVTAASRHGATVEIAEVIGRVLREHGVPAEVVRIDEIASLDGFDAVVLGSAVYMGHWLEAARQLVDARTVELAAKPVWLFSSGPVGDPPKPDEQPVDVGSLVATTNARGHRVFAGRLDPHRLGFAERAMTRALRAPVGDFRDWPAIEAWAAGIADTIHARQHQRRQP